MVSDAVMYCSSDGAWFSSMVLLFFVLCWCDDSASCCVGVVDWMIGCGRDYRRSSSM